MFPRFMRGILWIGTARKNLKIPPLHSVPINLIYPINDDFHKICEEAAIFNRLIPVTCFFLKK